MKSNTLIGIAAFAALGIGTYSAVKSNQAFNLAEDLARYATLQHPLIESREDLQHAANDSEKMQGFYGELRERQLSPDEFTVHASEYPYVSEFNRAKLFVFKNRDGIFLGGGQGAIRFDGYMHYLGGVIFDTSWKISEMEDELEDLMDEFKDR